MVVIAEVLVVNHSSSGEAVLAATSWRRGHHSQSELSSWSSVSYDIQQCEHLFQARQLTACSTLATCRPTSRSQHYGNTSRKHYKWLCHTTRKRRNGSGKCNNCGRAGRPGTAASWVMFPRHFDLSLCTGRLILDTLESRVMSHGLTTLTARLTTVADLNGRIRPPSSQLASIFHLLFLLVLGHTSIGRHCWLQADVPSAVTHKRQSEIIAQ